MSQRESISEKREEAAKVLRDILEKMCIDAEVSAFDDGERIILDAHGTESALVIGKKGATLDALQYLVSRSIFKNTSGAIPLLVDAEGYRGRREDSLIEMARKLAEKAIRWGRPVPVEPMSPMDRKTIHNALADFPGVKTESEGEGTERRVVIFPQQDGNEIR
jgi:spoIIIJ-associated protein